MKPEVSIIVPVYNVGKYVANAMKSLCRQTYRLFEVILVDDGCVDGSIEVALEQLKKTPDITYKVVRQENLGQGCARNRGVNEASGKWIMFMDADDAIQKEALDRMVSFAQKEECNIVFSDFQKVIMGHEFDGKSYDDGNEIIEKQNLQYQFLVRNIHLIVPGTLYNMEWYKKKNMEFKQLRFSEDVYFLWQAIVAADKIGYVHAALYNYLTRPNSIMTNANMKNVIEAYQSYCMLAEEMTKNLNAIDAVKKWIFDRWVLGVLRTSAVNFDWHNFKKVFMALDGKKHMKHMCGFPEKKARILALLIRISPKCYYKIMHRWGKW